MMKSYIVRTTGENKTLARLCWELEGGVELISEILHVYRISTDKEPTDILKIDGVIDVREEAIVNLI